MSVVFLTVNNLQGLQMYSPLSLLHCKVQAAKFLSTSSNFFKFVFSIYYIYDSSTSVMARHSAIGTQMLRTQS